MGQKISPLANRLPLSRDWRSRWLNVKSAPYFILEDATIRRLIAKRLGKNALIERIDIERDAQELRIGIYSAKPGVIIGRGGQGIAGLRTEIERTLQSLRDRSAKRLIRTLDVRKAIPSSFKLDVYEIKDGDRRAAIIAQTIASQIERRMAHRRTANQAIDRALGRGVQGVKIMMSGRLGGVDISRRESFAKGSMPTSSFNKEVDHAQATAMTTYGTVGVTVWVYRGETVRQGADALPKGKGR